MTILGNIHDGDKGRRVTALAGSRRLAGIAGEQGVVTDVESHGMNPWTRYGLRFDGGTRGAGYVFGEDFTFADGLAQTDTTRPAAGRCGCWNATRLGRCWHVT